MLFVVPATDIHAQEQLAFNFRGAGAGQNRERHHPNLVQIDRRTNHNKQGEASRGARYTWITTLGAFHG